MNTVKRYRRSGRGSALLLLLMLLLLLLPPALTVAQEGRVESGAEGWTEAPRGNWNQMHRGWQGDYFGPMPMAPWATPWLWILGVLLVALLVAVLVLLFRASGRGSGGGGESRSDGPEGKGWEDLLKERYARGEISREEYQQIREELKE